MACAACGVGAAVRQAAIRSAQLNSPSCQFSGGVAVVPVFSPAGRKAAGLWDASTFIWLWHPVMAG